jgi:pimeloyl-ACP methyl ester carboxylesterase
MTRRAFAVAAAMLLSLAGLAPVSRADERVQITATDGAQLVGHLAGHEGPGIVFGHMYPADQRSWTSFAEEMARAGFRTLTFDFRGYGESGGEKDIAAIDRDMEGAYRFLIGRKIRPVFLVGASMGGTAALIVAARVPVAGVATLSAPVAFRGLDAAPVLARLTTRKLFIAAEADAPAADAAKHFATHAPDPKTIQFVPGADHGTTLLEGPQAAAVRKSLRDFLATQAPP